MAQGRRGAGSALALAVADHGAALAGQGVARAVELAEVGEGLAAGSVGYFWLPFFAALIFGGRGLLSGGCFSGLPFGGVKI